ncbi:putative histone-like DNA-binding protein [Kordia periserrulae]|uniref:Putative histone-like DNA-binding protein n=1 Tax=Kordia periserrulae TaxID=701523 RepID=A0A2T6BY76_9FLAO|nr:HU family DNA-binding protein [Kordia periserrulae]PTX61029.1 putative histone-like DNA-binding protein [Kordia periserrulae]
MAIKYKVTERGTPGVSGGGSKKYYASATARQKIDLKQLSERLAAISTVSEIDTIAVLQGLVHLLPEYLCKGNSVSLGDFGTFSVHIRSEGKDTPEAVNAYSITDVKVSFRPSVEFKNRMKTVKFTKHK